MTMNTGIGNGRTRLVSRKKKGEGQQTVSGGKKNRMTPSCWKRPETKLFEGVTNGEGRWPMFGA